MGDARVEHSDDWDRKLQAERGKLGMIVCVCLVVAFADWGGWNGRYCRCHWRP